MQHSYRLPNRVPPGTKYVLESDGKFVRRYVEFPNGRRIVLPTRKAMHRVSTEVEHTLVPDIEASVTVRRIPA